MRWTWTNWRETNRTYPAKTWTSGYLFVRLRYNIKTLQTRGPCDSFPFNLTNILYLYIWRPLYEIRKYVTRLFPKFKAFYISKKTKFQEDFTFFKIKNTKTMFYLLYIIVFYLANFLTPCTPCIISSIQSIQIPFATGTNYRWIDKFILRVSFEYEDLHHALYCFINLMQRLGSWTIIGPTTATNPIKIPLFFHDYHNISVHICVLGDYLRFFS